MLENMPNTYASAHKSSIENPEEFWRKQADEIHWFKKPSIIKGSDPLKNEWFIDGKLNLAYLCVDKHVEDGFGSQTAIVYDSPVTDTRREISFNELQREVSKLAGGLVELGVKKGDTVIVYMPMIPQAMYAMLACARIGAIHSVVFGGFAPHELAIRINDSKPKAIICASNGIEIDKIIPYKEFVDKAIEVAEHKPQKVVIFDRGDVYYSTSERDVDYKELVSKAQPADVVPVAGNHPSYILYTSGTTGTPKGIIRDTGGYATALKFSMKNIYAVEPGDCFWAASDVGWVVGHSYIVYAPLINRNTTILFEGKPIKTPDASTFWRIIEENKVKTMFTAPTAIRAIRKEDPKGEMIKKFDLSHFKYFFLAGERCDAATLHWLKAQLGIPVIDHWWQTESGWPMLANMAGLELFDVKPGSASFPVCGYDIQILNADGEQLGPNEEGYVAVKLPLPPGNLVSLWQNPTRYQKGYLERFEGYYFSGDGGYKDEDGYYFITGRVDDVINVAGHRLSTAEMEEIVAKHPAVAECAVVGIHSDLKGQEPLGLIVLQSNVSEDVDQIIKAIINEVRKEIGPVASFKKVVHVQRLPKTRSGKTLRKLLRQIADSDQYNIPSTIDNVEVIGEIEMTFEENKVGRFKS